MQPVSAVLFDWDGTLADSCAVIRRASLTVYRHFGIPMDEARYRATFRPDWHESYRLLGIPEERWDEAGVIWGASYREHRNEVALYPGVAGMVGRLAEAGFALGIVTSADRQRFLEDLERTGIAARFGALAAFEDTPRKKPHPESLRLALRQLGVPPERALYAGDRHEDVEMGRRAGTRTAAVVSAFSDEALLLAARPDLLLAGILDLPDALAGLSGNVSLPTDPTGLRDPPGCPSPVRRAVPGAANRP